MSLIESGELKLCNVGAMQRLLAILIVLRPVAVMRDGPSWMTTSSLTFAHDLHFRASRFKVGCIATAIEPNTNQSIIKDERIQPHILYVVIEPEELRAEVYSHDKQLYRSWSLSEGRRRDNSGDLFRVTQQFSDADSARVPGQDEVADRDYAIIEELNNKDKRLNRAEKEMEELKLQLDRMREALQTQSEQGVRGRGKNNGRGKGREKRKR